LMYSMTSDADLNIGLALQRFMDSNVPLRSQQLYSSSGEEIANQCFGNVKP